MLHPVHNSYILLLYASTVERFKKTKTIFPFSQSQPSTSSDMYALSSTITSNQHHYLFLCPNYASLQCSRKLRNLCKTLLTHCKYQSVPYCIFLICIISPSYDLLDHQSLHVVWLHVGAMLQFLLLAPLREHNSIKDSYCTIP